MRYAVYLAPPPDSRFWQLGSAWLGRDAWSGRSVALPAGWSADAAARVAAAARYGWHATLRAPFALADGASAGTVHEAIRTLARRFDTFGLTLAPATLNGFAALRPVSGQPQVAELATAALLALDALAAPAPVRPGLSAREAELCRRWGYPYVFECYRCHFTLTGQLDEADIPPWLARAAAHFDGALCQPVDGLALFAEPEAGAAFRYAAWYGFDGREYVNAD